MFSILYKLLYNKNYYLKLIKTFKKGRNILAFFHIQKLNLLETQLFSIILQLKSKTFKFLPHQKFCIKTVSNIISIPSLVDCLVIFVLKNILDTIFGFYFKGFKKRQCLSFALKKVRNWINVKICLKGIFKNLFKRIDVRLLGQFIAKYVKDPFILNLYFNFIKVGYLNFKSHLFFCKYLGLENSLCFTLLNIFLYKFDLFFEKSNLVVLGLKATHFVRYGSN